MLVITRQLDPGVSFVRAVGCVQQTTVPPTHPHIHTRTHYTTLQFCVNATEVDLGKRVEAAISRLFVAATHEDQRQVVVARTCLC